MTDNDALQAKALASFAKRERCALFAARDLASAGLQSGEQGLVTFVTQWAHSRSKDGALCASFVGLAPAPSNERQDSPSDNPNDDGDTVAAYQTPNLAWRVIYQWPSRAEALRLGWEASNAWTIRAGYRALAHRATSVEVKQAATAMAERQGEFGGRFVAEATVRLQGDLLSQQMLLQLMRYNWRPRRLFPGSKGDCAQVLQYLFHSDDGAQELRDAEDMIRMIPGLHRFGGLTSQLGRAAVRSNDKTCPDRWLPPGGTTSDEEAAPDEAPAEVTP